MREDKLAERSMEFAVQIIELTKTLRMRKEFIMANQIGRSGTSIGANIREAHYAQSRDDFVSKLEIALKEANETDYWLGCYFVPAICLTSSSGSCGHSARNCECC